MALAAALLLSSPGVNLARAEEPAPAAPARPSASAEPVVCETTSPEQHALNLERLIRQARGTGALAQPIESNPDVPIVLNSRGFNYGPPPQTDPASVELHLLGLD